VAAYGRPVAAFSAVAYVPAARSETEFDRQLDDKLNELFSTISTALILSFILFLIIIFMHQEMEESKLIIRLGIHIASILGISNYQDKNKLRWYLIHLSQNIRHFQDYLNKSTTIPLSFSHKLFFCNISNHWHNNTE
jgi:hypothetical protein